MPAWHWQHSVEFPPEPGTFSDSEGQVGIQGHRCEESSAHSQNYSKGMKTVQMRNEEQLGVALRRIYTRLSFVTLCTSMHRYNMMPPGVYGRISKRILDLHEHVPQRSYPGHKHPESLLKSGYSFGGSIVKVVRSDNVQGTSL